MRDLSPGSALGDFQVQEVIEPGRYRAKQRSLDRIVELHVFSGPWNRAQEAVASLRHPNILPVYAAGREADLTYLALRHAPGPTLEERMLAPIPSAQAAKYGAEVAAALAYAHGRGITHGDVAPRHVVFFDDTAVLGGWTGGGSVQDDLGAFARILSRLVDSDFPSSKDPPGRISNAAEIRDALLERLTGPRPAPPPTSLPEPFAGARAPHRLGKYLLRRRLGYGGMGIVYCAEQEDLGRTVALKVLREDEVEADPKALERFHREAKAAARLRHENIVPIYEIGEFEGRHFFTMEYVEGSDVQELLKDGPLPVRRALEIVRDVARALDHAHQRGVIHRDIKPANLLVATNGRVLVSDFGLAKDHTSSSRRLTMSGTALGTPAYMSPEQLEGPSDRVGPASDIYSLGSVLYELLTGATPVAGNDLVQVGLQLMREEPTLPRSLNPKIPVEAETICRKAMRKDPRSRYASAGAMADDCDRFLAGQAIQARPEPILSHVKRRIRRHRVVLLALGAAFLLAGASFAAWGLVRRAREADRVEAIVTGAGGLEGRGDLARARDRYREALHIDPDHPKAMEGLNRVEIALQRRADDEREARLCLESGRRSFEAALLALYDRHTPIETMMARVKESRRFFETAVQKAPTIAEAHYLLGRAREMEGEEDRAEKAWREALRIDPRLGSAHYELGRLLFVRADRMMITSRGRVRPHRRRQARELVEAALRELDAAAAGQSAPVDRIHRDIAAVLRLLVSAELQAAADLAQQHLRKYTGRFREEFWWTIGLAATGKIALHAFQHAVSECPKHWRALAGLGETYIHMKEYALAEAYFSQVIQLRPRFASAYVNRGTARERQDKLDGALKDFDRALKLEPRAAVARHNRAYVFERQGRVDEALRDYAQAIRFDAGFVWTYVGRGHLHLLRSRLGDARADFEKAMKVDGRFAPAYVGRGLLHKRLRKTEDALRDFTQAIKLDPDLIDGHENRASLYNDLKKFEEAVTDATRAITIDPNSAFAYQCRGFARYSLDRVEEARKDFDRSIRLGPTARAYYFRAALRRRQEDHRGAIEDFTESIKLRRAWAHPYYHRAGEWLAIGDRDRARQDAEIALRLAPVGSEIRAQAEELVKRLR